MNLFQATILSIVEGLTEFLPISSTGHLILTSKLLNISQTEFVKSFEIVIQLGAILAVTLLYSQTLLRKKDVWIRILTAFLPTAIVGLIFYKIIKTFFLGNYLITTISLFVGGLIIIFFEKFFQTKEYQCDNIKDISIKKSFLVGFLQSISMIPGISRSAATIFAGLSLGLNRKTAVEFSFLLAIPTMFAATALDLIKSNFNFTLNEYFILSIGFVGSFISAYLTIEFFLKYIKKNNFLIFGVYRIILAVFFWMFIKG